MDIPTSSLARDILVGLAFTFFPYHTQFKNAVAEKFNAQSEQLCLIFAGKIMKDHETLGTHKVKDGLTVHLVVKAPRTATQNTPNDATPTPRPRSIETFFLSFHILLSKFQ